MAQIVQFNLKQIGLNVNSHLFARAVQIDKEGTRGEPFDITSEGWIADYADPYDFINVLLVRRQHPRLEQQQRRVLQRPDLQQADDAPPRCCRVSRATRRTATSTSR